MIKYIAYGYRNLLTPFQIFRFCFAYIQWSSLDHWMLHSSSQFSLNVSLLYLRLWKIETDRICSKSGLKTKLNNLPNSGHQFFHRFSLGIATPQGGNCSYQIAVFIPFYQNTEFIFFHIASSQRNSPQKSQKNDYCFKLSGISQCGQSKI